MFFKPPCSTGLGGGVVEMSGDAVDKSQARNPNWFSWLFACSGAHLGEDQDEATLF